MLTTLESTLEILIPKIQGLGFSEQEASILSVLLLRPNSTVSQIRKILISAEVSKVQRTEMYLHLKVLEERGFIQSTKLMKPKLLCCLSASQLTKRAITEREKEIAEIEKTCQVIKSLVSEGITTSVDSIILAVNKCNICHEVFANRKKLHEHKFRMHTY